MLASTGSGGTDTGGARDLGVGGGDDESALGLVRRGGVPGAAGARTFQSRGSPRSRCDIDVVCAVADALRLSLRAATGGGPREGDDGEEEAGDRPDVVSLRCRSSLWLPIANRFCCDLRVRGMVRPTSAASDVDAFSIDGAVHPAMAVSAALSAAHSLLVALARANTLRKAVSACGAR